MGTPISDLVNEMLVRDIPREIIAMAVRAVELHGQMLCKTFSKETIRSHERERKRQQRENCPGQIDENAPINTPVEGTLKLELGLEGSKQEKERKKDSYTRTRAKQVPCRLPDDWQPNLDDLAFARKILHVGRVPIEIEKFRDYWHARAGPGAVKINWSATFRNWCRKAAEDRYGPQNSPNGSGGQAQRGKGFSAYAAECARRAAGTDGTGD